MNPIIFLDFDGVLNSLRSMLALGGCLPHQFDSVAVNIMARLAKVADARVVVSSSWRVGSNVLALRAILSQYSASLAVRVIDVTPSLPGCRGEEIAQWLVRNPHRHNGSYLIVDDDSDMLDAQLPHFVQTRQRDGFGVREYLRALSIIVPTHADVTNLAWYAEDRPLFSTKHQLPERLVKAEEDDG